MAQFLNGATLNSGTLNGAGFDGSDKQKGIVAGRVNPQAVAAGVAKQTPPATGG